MECKETRICGCFKQRNGLNVPSECAIPNLCRKFKNLEAELFGVMYTIEKWFNEDDERLKNNPSTVAGNAREVALKAIEELELKNHNLEDKLDFSEKQSEVINEMYNELCAENKELRDALSKLTRSYLY